MNVGPERSWIVGQVTSVIQRMAVSVLAVAPTQQWLVFQQLFPAWWTSGVCVAEPAWLFH